MFSRRIFVVLIIFILSTCGSTNNREELILDYPDESINKYESFLIEIKEYTTNGAKYHKKYYKYLIGIARIITEEKELTIVENSVGFYYDKKENSKNKLFLGVDIKTPFKSSIPYSYEKTAATQLKKYLKDMLYILRSCNKIFSEREIVGIVVGLRWKVDNRTELANIWIDKDDVMRYEKKRLTFDELVHRSTITNINGEKLTFF